MADKNKVWDYGMVQKRWILGNSWGGEGVHRWTVVGIEVARVRVG